jgi:hypothetical protein
MSIQSKIQGKSLRVWASLVLAAGLLVLSLALMVSMAQAPCLPLALSAARSSLMAQSRPTMSSPSPSLRTHMSHLRFRLRALTYLVQGTISSPRLRGGLPR